MGEGSVSVSSACLRGAQAQPVRVEVAASGGIPGLTIVGMPDTGVLDARSRVRCALKACGFIIGLVSLFKHILLLKYYFIVLKLKDLSVPRQGIEP